MVTAQGARDNLPSLPRKSCPELAEGRVSTNRAVAAVDDRRSLCSGTPAPIACHNNSCIQIPLRLLSPAGARASCPRWGRSKTDGNLRKLFLTERSLNVYENKGWISNTPLGDWISAFRQALRGFVVQGNQ